MIKITRTSADPRDQTMHDLLAVKIKTSGCNSFLGDFPREQRSSIPPPFSPPFEPLAGGNKNIDNNLQEKIYLRFKDLEVEGIPQMDNSVYLLTSSFIALRIRNFPEGRTPWQNPRELSVGSSTHLPGVSRIRRYYNKVNRHLVYTTMNNLIVFDDNRGALLFFFYVHPPQDKSVNRKRNCLVLLPSPKRQLPRNLTSFIGVHPSFLKTSFQSLKRQVLVLSLIHI